jgi:predicted Zn-dependent peptidase
MIYRFIFLLILLCFGSPFIQAAPNAQILDIAIETAGSYQISLWVPFGSTSDSIPGIAHVLEHLKFKTKGGHGFSGFDAIAGSSSNAATTYDFTRFDLSVPAEGLIAALETLSGITRPLSITEADLKIEKTVVQQEILQRTQGDPDTPFYLDFYSELYKGFAYANPPAGKLSDVESVTMKDVLAFDAAHYRNSKIFLVIAGPPLPNRASAAIAELFPKAVAGAIYVDKNFAVKRHDTALLPLPIFLQQQKITAMPASEFHQIKKSPRTQRVKLSILKLISAPTPWRQVLAASILSSAIRSRLPEGLNDRIAEENRIVQNWSISISPQSEGLWLASFSATVEEGASAESVRKALEDYLAEIGKTGISKQSFDRLKARNFLLSEWEDASSRATSLGGDVVTFGYAKASSFDDVLRTVEFVDVNAVIKIILMPGRVGVAELQPEGLQQ